ncbi:unnamed protein product [Moneuplotes crassus]|uniref:Tubulin/FtsZ GTPase domain-containing protein n=1 Tax=Euplotes crassus TaxID=5936 RepID=A0AAD1XD70_EUPCR|nr:unnamed protein product [Moneuplotes crassus]
MREILNFHFGKGGINTGMKYWETISEEHHLDSDGFPCSDDELSSEYRGINFKETPDGNYSPRAILADTDSSFLESAIMNYSGPSFDPHNFIAGERFGLSCWAKGYYTDGAEIIDHILDAARKEVEACSNPQGFQLCHSIGGGTGSGMGCLLLSRLKEEFPAKMCSTFSIFPSQKVSEIAIETYNATLAIDKLTEDCDLVNVIDNEALYDINTKILHIESPEDNHLNDILIPAYSSITSCQRFRGESHSTLRRVCMEMVPLPRFPFLMMSSAPLSLEGILFDDERELQNVTQQIFTAKHFLCGVDIRHGRHLSGNAIFRGNCTQKDADMQIMNTLNRSSYYFADYIAHPCKNAVVPVPSKDFNLSGSLHLNSTSINEMFRRIKMLHKDLYSKQKFMFNYRAEGLENQEMEDAYSNLVDLIQEYQQVQDFTAEEEGEFDEEL